MAEVLDLTASDDDATQLPPSPRNENNAVKSENTPQLRCIPRPQFNNDQDAPKLTTVNGKGFWKSWERSFSTTLLKLLDLIDNSVDAATILHDTTTTTRPSGFTGRVYIYPDARKGKKYTSTTGLCIRNNCPRKIVPLSEALVVHQTTKEADAGEIGENGVGLKQACAALCDLSFVLVKNGSNANIELGIVAKSLQREEGPYLPAFQFSNEKGNGQLPLREQMVSLFSQPKHNDVAGCIANYGADVSGGDPSLASGIDGLCKRFDDMCHNFFGNDHVFEVILNRIRHGDQGEGLVRRAMDAQQKITVHQLIKDLQREIPKTYLHIPESFDFVVGKQKLAFKYWQERLVEFSTFTVTVGATIPWKQNFEVVDEHPDSYDLRLFMGFDRNRIADPDVDADTGEKRQEKNASLYIYSRHSGRLIKSEPDARHMLGLSTGSSIYGSALTIIIDDIGSHLPLHPTKQDTAFGLERKGAVHEENLLAWVGAVTKFFYNYHWKKFNRQKKILSSKVSHYVGVRLPKEPKAYIASDYTCFELVFEQYRNTIRVDPKLVKEIIGPDTYFRLLPDSNVENPKGQGKKRSRSSAQGERPGKKSVQQPLPCGPGTTAKRSKSQHDSGSGSDEGAGVKMESMGNHVDSSECINLCESSGEDDEGTASGDEEGDARETQKLDAGSTSKTTPQSDSVEKEKIHELEQVIIQLRGESKSKIESLENENEALKGELLRKENVIAVLKRRLGAK
ncbi:hypothetical protein ACHAXR_012095 [Thalassiosira sp. AJA248-18]